MALPSWKSNRLTVAKSVIQKKIGSFKFYYKKKLNDGVEISFVAFSYGNNKYNFIEQQVVTVKTVIKDQKIVSQTVLFLVQEKKFLFLIHGSKTKMVCDAHATQKPTESVYKPMKHS